MTQQQDDSIARKGGWRYQPVITTGEDDVIFLIEIHLDGDKRLRSWSAPHASAPLGETVEEISRDIVHMYMASVRWKPVRYEDLNVGMTFEENFDQTMAIKLASMFEAMKQ